jgi:hypothetical protein
LHQNCSSLDRTRDRNCPMSGDAGYAETCSLL